MADKTLAYLLKDDIGKNENNYKEFKGFDKQCTLSQ
jgi:hypothetical protein